MLIYTTDKEPGIRRKGAGKGFFYVDPSGRKVSDPATLARIRSLAIPPAYSGVWICPFDKGHLQATGRDARKRKQYRYHPDWQTVRNLDKFDRLPKVGAALPVLRRRLRAELKRFDGEKPQVVAAAIRMIDKLGYRVGNDISLKENNTRGVSTLHNKNVALTTGHTLRVAFVGKGGKKVSAELNDTLLARAIEQCHELPGQRLFTYTSRDGSLHSIDSGDINGFLADIYDDDITAKDLRTWRASAEAVAFLQRIRQPEDRESEIREAIRHAAGVLNNRYATCRKHYVHPQILEAYSRSGRWGFSRLQPRPAAELQQAERLLLRILGS